MSDSHKLAESIVSHAWSVSDCGMYGLAGEGNVAQTPQVSTPTTCLAKPLCAKSAHRMHRSVMEMLQRRHSWAGEILNQTGSVSWSWLGPEMSMKSKKVSENLSSLTVDTNVKSCLNQPLESGISSQVSVASLRLAGSLRYPHTLIGYPSAGPTCPSMSVFATWMASWRQLPPFQP